MNSPSNESQVVSSAQEGGGVPDDSLNEYARILREKILFGLEIYPAVSPTMLHTFLGTATSTHVWKPILNDLIAEGLVARVEVTMTSPHDRTQTYSVLHRTDKPYALPNEALDSVTSMSNDTDVDDNSNAV